MTVTLDKSHELKGNGYLLGVGGENESEQLIINIAYDVLLDKWAYIEFEQNGAKHTTERLTIANGQIVYTLLNSVLVQGHINIQVVFRDANGFNWKSFKRQFAVSDEINATESLPEQHPDFIAKAQSLLDGITENSEKIDTFLSSDAEKARVAAEEQRKINEAGRVDAETARRTEFSGWANSLGNLNTYDKRLINLEEVGVGTLFDYVKDDTTAYSKAVPVKALPYARLVKVGGMSYKADNALIDTKVKSVGGYAIPEAVQLLDGYGLGINNTCYNYIDFASKAFVKVVQAVGNLDNLVVNLYREDQNTIAFVLRDAIANEWYKRKALCNLFERTFAVLTDAEGFANGDTTADVYIRISINKLLEYGYSATATHATKIQAFKDWLKDNPTTIIYELATPIETDISAYITDNYIKVNGTVVFENDAAAAVPSEIIYAVKR